MVVCLLSSCPKILGEGGGVYLIYHQNACHHFTTLDWQRPAFPSSTNWLTSKSFSSAKVLIVQVVFSPIYCNVST